MLKLIKRLIYPCAQWVADKASDLVYWSGDLHEYEFGPMDLSDVVIGTIKREPLEFWDNAVASNALLQKLERDHGKKG